MNLLYILLFAMTQRLLPHHTVESAKKSKGFRGIIFIDVPFVIECSSCAPLICETDYLA